MSFLRSSTSFSRFRITDQVPSALWPEVIDKLRQFNFKDIDDIPEDQSFGWVSFEDFLDTEFTTSPVEKGVYLAFGLRLDTRRVPPAVIRKHLAVALKKEEAHNREQGKKFVGRERKKELKEQVMLVLKRRFLPIPAEFQIIWNTTDSTVYFTSTQGKMLDLFQELFTRTFDLHLELLTPYTLATSISGSTTAALETLEPTTFA